LDFTFGGVGMGDSIEGWRERFDEQALDRPLDIPTVRR
jgi:hypothetical protein